MSNATTASGIPRESALLGQTVVVIGGSAGIGLKRPDAPMLKGPNYPHRRQSRAASARRERVRCAEHCGVRCYRFRRLGRFFDDLTAPMDHVLVTGPGPYYAPLADFDFEKARREIEAHLLLPIQRSSAALKRFAREEPCSSWRHRRRRTATGLALISALTAALPAMTKNLALELAPVRVNLIAAGFVDTPLSESLLGDELENRRNQLRATLPIRRVVGPADVAAFAVHIMINTAFTGATYDIDGGQQLVEA